MRLVPPDDPAYVAAMADQALAHRRFGPKEEQTATYRISGGIERGVRAWLAERVPMMDERIVAADVLYRDSRAYEPLFLELDAVEGEEGFPRRIYEVKFTSNAGALRRGFGQLARARDLLESRYERIEVMLVLVQADRGPLSIEDPRLADVVQVTPADVVHAGPAPGRALLRLDPVELAAYLEADDLALLSTARDEGDANVSARQERLAALERGEELPPRERRPPRAGATISFGDEPEDDEEKLSSSPFAALRALASGRESAPGPGGDR